MGLNAYFTFGVVQGLGVDWPIALTAVLIEGVLFMALAMTGMRTLLVNAIPHCIKIATITGIGLFLAIIGFENAKLTVDHPATLVTLGNLKDPSVLLALGGIVLIGALLVKRIKGAVLIGILALTLVAWLTGLAPVPDTFVALPQLPRETLMAIDFSQAFTGAMLTVVIAFLFVDLFDTAGTLLGVGRLAGLLDKDGNLPGSERAFMSDATGTTAGALLGTSTVTTYIESATGIEEGGRTGLTAVVVAALFADRGRRDDDARRARTRLDTDGRGGAGVPDRGHDAVHLLNRPRHHARDRLLRPDPCRDRPCRPDPPGDVGPGGFHTL
jgi:AGZA family xanthine/uracil permease-like MFS transporter